MFRQLQNEILDTLPPGDPAARASRRDLRIFNRVMGSERWFARMLAKHVRPTDRVLEFGAGDGELGRRLARRVPRYDGLDRCPRPATWPATSTWHAIDLWDFAGWADYRVVTGNLFFHHFTEEELALVGAELAATARVILLHEPLRRRRFQVLFALLCRLIRAHQVSRHDGRISIAAGFQGDELPALLGLDAPEWNVRVSATVFGGYRMEAVRRP